MWSKRGKKPFKSFRSLYDSYVARGLIGRPAATSGHADNDPGKTAGASKTEDAGNNVIKSRRITVKDKN
jgi:hypothetical protein